MPKEICDIHDELKTIYHSKDTIFLIGFLRRGKIEISLWTKL
jgi:hypothetical protein